MKRYCSDKLTTECDVWRDVMISFIIMTATTIIAIHLFGIKFDSVFSDTIVITASVLSAFWCLWTVRAIRGMLSWWRELHASVNSATALLKETKEDIKEIKKML